MLPRQLSNKHIETRKPTYDSAKITNGTSLAHLLKTSLNPGFVTRASEFCTNLGGAFKVPSLINKHAITKSPVFKPALARTVVANDTFGLPRSLLSMSGWTIAPTDDPECTRIIARDWRRLKCCETTATVGRYARPLPKPYPTPWERKTWFHIAG
jgi:hypothetical protein